MKPALSLILPANNEAAHIQACLQSVVTSDPLPNAGALQVIVVANGCSDDTANRARELVPAFDERGWVLTVLELAQGSKIAALNTGDAAAKAEILGYLDADVILSPAVVAQTVATLSSPQAGYASGVVRLPASDSFVTRCYATFYVQTPFMKQDAPGCGYFAMNRAGRARWAEWPTIISDDTFARLKFAPDERHQFAAPYQWPLVDGLKNLIKVRRRQNAGVNELAKLYPEIFANDSKLRFTLPAALKAAMRHPLGALVYGFVSISVKITVDQGSEWKRGR